MRNGYYRSLTAHLMAINDWALHLHARVAWGESLTWNGQPYGRESVRPSAIRCFACTDYDVAASGDGGFYTDYYYGRWMKY